MVGSLKLLEADPNSKRRGKGYYYHRGKGKFSKYDEYHDAQIFHDKTETRDVVASNTWNPHKADYRTVNKKVKTSRLGNKNPKGYF